MKNKFGLIFVAFAIFFLTGCSSGYDTDGYSSYEDREEDPRIEEYQAALEEANQTIESQNEAIEEAKYYAWESYDEMGQALDNLDTADTVSEP